MIWRDVSLTEDQSDVRDMVLEWRESLEPINTDEDVDAVEAARHGMVELGVWSIGMSESVGGGGADLDLQLVALAAVAGHSAALAWAAAQAHAAVDLLASESDMKELLERIVGGEQPVGVVNLSSTACHITIADGKASGKVVRVDAAGPSPALVIFDDDATWLVEPSQVRTVEAHRRTGFAGAGTASFFVDGVARRIAGGDVNVARARLLLAGAAIAAGIALDASELASGYAATRMQFGGPLTALPTVRNSLEIQRRLALESLSIALGDDGSSYERATGTLIENLGRAMEVASAALQTHGGYGYIEEYGVARLVRDAVSLRAATSVI